MQGGGDSNGEKEEGVKTKERRWDRLFFSCEGSMRGKEVGVMCGDTVV